jgi:preprotein translocase subunit Sec61beta
MRRYKVDPRIAVLIGILLVFLLQPIAALESIFASDASGFGTDR